MANRSERILPFLFQAVLRPLGRLWKPLLWVWITIVVGIGINIASSFLITQTTSFTLHGTPLGWLVEHPWVASPLTVGFLLVTILTWMASQQPDVPAMQIAQQMTLTPQQRLQVIRSLQQEYTSRLTHSLQGRVAIELGLYERTDVIASSAQLVFHHADTATKYPLPPGTSIIQIYDRAQRGLLILGEPGSGKTTLLLNLVIELLHRAEGDLNQPVPIILNLASWAQKKPALVDWLCEQCALIYGIPMRVGASWIASNQLLFLLDGLDEVEASALSACINATNLYREEHLVPLVICSRSRDYENQEARLILPAAVEIRPLEGTQIEAYLKQAGRSLAAVRTALGSNKTLQLLLTSPLMLTIVILTYRNKTVKDLPQMGSLEEQQLQIFQHYVQRMLERHQSRRTISSFQLSCSLRWLAQQMQHRQLTEFYLESLQSTWIAAKPLQILYQLLVGSVTAVFVTIAFTLFFTLLFGPILGLGIGLVCGLLSGLSHGLGDITPIEALVWSWKKARKNLIWYLIVGCASVTIIAVLNVQKSASISVLTITLVFILLFISLLILQDGLSGASIDVSMRLKPNQGIHDSGRNALRAGIMTMLVTGVFYGTVAILSALLEAGVHSRVASGQTTFLPLPFGLGLLFFGLYQALNMGGYAYLTHYLLRVFLWRSTVLPWHAVPLLEEAVACILLQRVGGGYRFIHPLLQEYFASLGTSSAAS